MSSPSNPDDLLCHCHGVTWRVVRQTIQQHNCTSIAQVTRQCRAGGGCRSCHVEIHELLQEAARKHGMLKRLWLWLRH